VIETDEGLVPDPDLYAEVAGDPAEAANLPATTGRDTETNEPDVPLAETEER